VGSKMAMHGAFAADISMVWMYRYGVLVRPIWKLRKSLMDGEGFLQRL